MLFAKIEQLGHQFKSGLVNISIVQCFVEFSGVGDMLFRGGSKVVPSAEVLFGTEVYVVCLFVFEHGINGGGRRYADGTGGKTGVEVGVVGTIGLEHVAFDASDGEITYGIFDGGVGL